MAKAAPGVLVRIPSNPVIPGSPAAKREYRKGKAAIGRARAAKAVIRTGGGDKRTK